MPPESRAQLEADGVVSIPRRSGPFPLFDPLILELKYPDLVGIPLLKYLVAPHNTLYSTPAVNRPILIGSKIAAGIVLLWATRPARGRIERAAGLFLGILLAFASLGVYMVYGFSALLVLPAAVLIVGGTVVASVRR